VFGILKGRTRRQAPRVPGGVRIYAVGDIHGRADLLADLLGRIARHAEQYPVVRPIQIFLGDYIDRGPASRDVLDMLSGLHHRESGVHQRESGVHNRESGVHDRESVFLRGNHETFLEEFLRNPASLALWQYNGGLETLMSYELRPSFNPTLDEQLYLARSLGRIFPPGHAEFLRNLDMTFTCGDFFFVHAGVRPGVPLHLQRDEDLLWIREEFLSSEQDFGKVIVHGHTPVMEPEFRPNRINIDTGAFATGRLSCLVIEGHQLQML
jgi:serine/threonine protein phosphatase 1